MVRPVSDDRVSRLLSAPREYYQSQLRAYLALRVVRAPKIESDCHPTKQFLGVVNNLIQTQTVAHHLAVPFPEALMAQIHGKVRI